jgi:hypothetical protein
MAGQGGQGSRCGGPREVPFLLKKSLGKTGDLHLIKQILFIIEIIKKLESF